MALSVCGWVVWGEVPGAGIVMDMWVEDAQVMVWHLKHLRPVGDLVFRWGEA